MAAVEMKTSRFMNNLRTKLGPGVTPTKETLDKKDWNILATTFRNALPAAEKEKYKKLSSDAVRADWIGQWAMDPEGSVARGFNRTTVTESEVDASRDTWVTEAQLGGPEFLNSVQHANIVINAGDLGEGRPHEYDSLAAAGVLQYKVTTVWLEKMKGVKKEAGVDLKDELTTEQYAEVKSEMDTARTQKVKPVKKLHEKKVEDPLLKELRLANGKLSSSLRSLKRKCDGVADDCENLINETISKLAKKGYPAEMQAFMKSKVTELQQLTATTREIYQTFVCEPDATNTADLQRVKDKITKSDESALALAKAVKDFNKAQGADLKKLAAGA